MVEDTNQHFEGSLLSACDDVIDGIELLKSLLYVVHDQGASGHGSVREEHFHRIGQSTATIVRLTKEWVESEKDEDVFLDLLQTLSKSLRKHVLNYLPSTKAAFANPSDISIKEDQRKDYEEVDKYTQGFCAVVEILHRQRMRATGINFGLIDQMDQNSSVLIKLAYRLEGEAGTIIQMALKSDPFEILSYSDNFARAIDQFTEMVEIQHLPQAVPIIKRLQDQQRIVMNLSKDAASISNQRSLYSEEDLFARASVASANISDQILNLLLLVIRKQQLEWRVIIEENQKQTQARFKKKKKQDKRALVFAETQQKSSPSGMSLLTSPRPKKPQRPSRAVKSSRVDANEALKLRSDISVKKQSKTRSVRVDYERKYGLESPFSEPESPDSPAYETSVDDSEKEVNKDYETSFAPRRSSKLISGLHAEHSSPSLLLDIKESRLPPSSLTASENLAEASSQTPKEKVAAVERMSSTPSLRNQMDSIHQQQADFQYHSTQLPDSIQQQLNQKKKELQKTSPDAAEELAKLFNDDVDVSASESTYTGSEEPQVRAHRLHHKKGKRKTLPSSAGRLFLKNTSKEAPSNASAQAKAEIALHEHKDKKGIDEQHRITLEATMASAVPIVLGLFSSEFSWFAKEWDRVPTSQKQKFTTKMRNELTHVKWYEPAVKKEDGPAAGARGSMSLKKPMLPGNDKNKQSTGDDIQDQIVPLSDKVRWFHRSTSLSNVMTPQTAETLKQGEKELQTAIETIIDIVHQQLEPQKSEQSTQAAPKVLSTTIVGLYTVLRKIISLSTNAADNRIVRQMSTPTLEFIGNAPHNGEADEHVIGRFSTESNYHQLQTVLTLLRLNTYDKLQCLYSLTIQAIHALRSFDLNMKKISHADTLQLVACTRSIVETIENVINQLATYIYLRSQFTQEKCSKKIQTAASYNYPVKSDAEPYWERKINENESIDRGSLQFFLGQLIEHHEELPTEYEKAFLQTYRTLCPATVLFNKLKECFYVPDSAELETIQKLVIQNRVLQLLAHWVDTQYSDIDQSVLDEIKSFAASNVQNSDLAERASEIEKVLQQKEKEQESQFNKVVVIDKLDWAKVTHTNMYEMFLQMDEKLIAQQLTLMDFSIFKRIQIAELLGQSWNKNKHCAANVIDHITRLNHVSYWVPSLILWSEKLKQRGQVLWKFVQIGKELLKLHNYNTLMGLVAGLNMSSVTRLKFTSSLMADRQIEVLDELLELMAPFHSYKKYREHVQSVQLPAIPYLGVYLTDLTFIDEGNPSMINGMINFKKRVAISKVLTQIQYFQSVPYEIAPQEPLFTYLKELAFLDDEGLYQLSLAREPRDAEIFDIV